MKVKELRKILETYDGDLEVFFTQTNDEYTHSLLLDAKVEEISFVLETETGIETAVENCLILTDE